MNKIAVKPAILEFPVVPDVGKIIEIVGKTPDSFLLDSADPAHHSRRYSYAGFAPQQIVSGYDNPWLALEEIYREIATPIDSTVPFCGGLVGFLTYESGQNPPRPPLTKGGMGGFTPVYWFGLYDSVLVFDHINNRTLLISWKLSSKELKAEADRWMHLFESTPIRNEQSGMTGKIEIPWEYGRYQEKIQRIKDYLMAGDVYQINLTGRFRVETTRSASSIYKRLRKISPAPYSAFLNTGEMQILSASPECFFEIVGDTIITRPIKGTRKRSPDLAEDARIREDLLASEKDHAELLMIVDLERNDLGKICEYGSVKVDSLFRLETFAQVHHLVATVSGQLKADNTPVDALKALFPGGSVTGAPKIRAMEIIWELEENPRSVYTGALGYIGAGGNALFNIPIRTLTKAGEKTCFHAGGGIVIDSDPRAEYEEMMAKAAGMIRAVNGE